MSKRLTAVASNRGSRPVKLCACLRRRCSSSSVNWYSRPTRIPQHVSSCMRVQSGFLLAVFFPDVRRRLMALKSAVTTSPQYHVQDIKVVRVEWIRLALVTHFNQVVIVRRQRIDFGLQCVQPCCCVQIEIAVSKHFQCPNFTITDITIQQMPEQLLDKVIYRINFFLLGLTIYVKFNG